MPDNSEIRFNNVGVGKDGTTSLSTSIAWSVGVNNADGVIIADNIVGNGESGLALANSNGLMVVRNFIGVDREGDDQGNTNEGIDVQQTDREAAAERARQRQHDPLQQLEGLIISNADRTIVSGNVITDNGEGVSVSGDNNTIGPGNTVARQLHERHGRRGRRRCRQHDHAELDPRQPRSRDRPGARRSGITPNDVGDVRHRAERPAELPGALERVGRRRVARRRLHARLEAEHRVHDRVLRPDGLRRAAATAKARSISAAAR